ncbi:MAG: HNH endonuclease, partial [Candidatus Nanopelagicales bacterium]|nr:HNH endonuclease [Candidatus Nanopelagicales bacterium]
LSGMLPRLEGEAVIAAVQAFAERLRTQADHVPAPARRADGLVALVNAAHATGTIPSRGGLPVSVSVTLDTTTLGDPVWTTSHGHTLTNAEARFTCCDALVTPIQIDHPKACPDTLAELLAAGQAGGQTDGSTTGARSGGPGGAGAPSPSAPGIPGAGSRAAGGAGFTAAGPSAAERIAALARTLLGTRIPIAVGRTARTATPAQRRALAARDRGCIIPGCTIPAEACQTHHVQDWAAGGSTDLPNLALVCWAHHRQVDLGMWTIEPADPDKPARRPDQGAPPGTPWPANNNAPWTITRTPRTRWSQ